MDILGTDCLKFGSEKQVHLRASELTSFFCCVLDNFMIQSASGERLLSVINWLRSCVCRQWIELTCLPDHRPASFAVLYNNPGIEMQESDTAGSLVVTQVSTQFSPAVVSLSKKIAAEISWISGLHCSTCLPKFAGSHLEYLCTMHSVLIPCVTPWAFCLINTSTQQATPAIFPSTSLCEVHVHVLG